MLLTALSKPFFNVEYSEPYIAMVHTRTYIIETNAVVLIKTQLFSRHSVLFYYL